MMDGALALTLALASALAHITFKSFISIDDGSDDDGV